jgi:hypothetical protein
MAAIPAAIDVAFSVNSFDGRRTVKDLHVEEQTDLRSPTSWTPGGILRLVVISARNLLEQQVRVTHSSKPRRLNRKKSHAFFPVG